MAVEGAGGGGGAKSYNSEKAWSSVTHSILPGIEVWGGGICQERIMMIERQGEGKGRCFIPRDVEGLYCKRPIQYLASSELLTPQPLTAHRVSTVYLPAFGAGEDTLAGVRGGGAQVGNRPLTTLFCTG